MEVRLNDPNKIGGVSYGLRCARESSTPIPSECRVEARGAWAALRGAVASARGSPSSERSGWSFHAPSCPFAVGSSSRSRAAGVSTVPLAPLRWGRVAGAERPEFPGRGIPALWSLILASWLPVSPSASVDQALRSWPLAARCCISGPRARPQGSLGARPSLRVPRPPTP